MSVSTPAALTTALSASATTWVLAALATTGIVLATTFTTARIVLSAAAGVARARIPAAWVLPAALLTLARLRIVSHYAFPFPS